MRTEAPTHRGGGNDRTGKINRGLEWGRLKLKIIIHVFGLSWCPTYRRHGMPPRDMRAIGKESCGLEQICGCRYVHFETILGFTRNEQIRCSEAFRGNTKVTKHQRKVTTQVGFLRNISGENIIREVQKCLKNSQN